MSGLITHIHVTSNDRLYPSHFKTYRIERINGVALLYKYIEQIQG